MEFGLAELEEGSAAAVGAVPKGAVGPHFEERHHCNIIAIAIAISISSAPPEETEAFQIACPLTEAYALTNGTTAYKEGQATGSGK